MEELESIYRACAPLAFRRARSLLGDDAEAWDVVHEVFERMARDTGRLRGGTHPMTYVYRGTTNACINRWRRREVRNDPRAVHAIAARASADASLDSALAARQLVDALWDELDATDRRILVMHFVDGLPQAEIAATLSIWRRTVGRRLTKIRAMARALQEQTA